MLTGIQTQRRGNPLLYRQRQSEFRETQKIRQADGDKTERAKNEIVTAALKTPNHTMTLIDLQNKIVWTVATYGQWEACLTFQ